MSSLPRSLYQRLIANAFPCYSTVWQEVSSALSSLAGAWWDQPKEVRDAIAKFRRTLFGPVADRLGELILSRIVREGDADSDLRRLRVRRERRRRHHRASHHGHHDRRRLRG